MELTKEDVYIDLRGKSREELIDIYNLLISLKQNMHGSLESVLDQMSGWKCYEFYAGVWCLSNNTNKKEVTINQLKEILQPMDLNLKQQLQKAEAEVKRLRKAIEESKIKNGDWCTFWDHDKNKFIIAKYQGNKFVCMTTGDYLLNCEKITDPDLLESLNKLF